MLSRFSLTVAVVTTLLAPPIGVVPFASADEELGGLTNVWSQNSDGKTTVGANRHSSKTSPGHRGNSGSHNAGRGGIQDAVYIPPPRRTEMQCAAIWDWSPFCFTRRGDAEKVDEVVKALQEKPAITISDLATFSPAAGTVSGEPDNLGVVGLPTNFVVSASAHTRSGTLFDMPVDVRFTPTSYTFHYGDGESRASDTPGASWASLAQAQFTPTATSHTYSERGTYEARADVVYTAEIDLGVGWFPVPGQLTIRGAPQSIRIYEAHTALVARTCAEQPAAPGC